MRIVFKTIKLVFYLILFATFYNLFTVPINLVAGGPGGAGILFEYLFGIDKALTVFIVSFIIMILAFIFLEKDEAYFALVITIAFPLAVKLTGNITDIIHIDTSHKLLLVIFGAITTGAVQGTLLSNGLTSGGFTIVSKIIYKYTHISITLINALINLILIILGGYFIGIEIMLYAIIYIAIMTDVSERVMLGVSSNKTFEIISDHYEEIQEFIHNELMHDLTLYDTIGSYDGDKRKMIMTVVPTAEYIVLKDFVKSVDKNAFIFVTNTYDINRQDETIRKEAI